MELGEEAFLGVNAPRSGTYQTDRFSFIFEERYTLGQKALNSNVDSVVHHGDSHVV